MRLRHGREELHAGRVDATLAAPLDRDAVVDDPLADRLDALGLQQEVVVDEVDRAVAVLLELLELVDDVRRAARAPLALVEDRDVAEHARPRAAARGLHGREALEREHRRHVERHRLDEVERQALAVGERPLVEVARPAGGSGCGAACRPSPARSRRPRCPGSSSRSSRSRISCSPSPRQTKSTSGHCSLTSCGVERGEDAAEGELHRRVGRRESGGPGSSRRDSWSWRGSSGRPGRAAAARSRSTMTSSGVSGLA